MIQEQLLRLDLNSELFKRDRYQILRLLRENKPIVYIPNLKCYLITSYEYAKNILDDKRVGKAFLDSQVKVFGEKAKEQKCFKTMNDWMLFSNPPEHTLLRRSITDVFSLSRISLLREAIENIVDEKIEEFNSKITVDLVSDFSHQIPFFTICEILGIPKEDHKILKETVFKNDYLSFILDLGAYNTENIAIANEFFTAISDYLKSLLSIKKNLPDDKLITKLLFECEQKKEITLEQLVSNISLLFLAGHETTSNTIASGILYIAKNNLHHDIASFNEEQIQRMVEEIIRCEPSIQLTARTAFEDLEIGDAKIKKGDLILISLASANRDSKFFENSEQFNIDREIKRNLSFGGGIHYCPGAQLAKLQTAIAIRKLFQAFPHLKIQNMDGPIWRASYVLRGLVKLEASLK